MTDREFTLKLGIPRFYPRPWPHRYSAACNHSDGLQECECVNHSALEECIFYGRPIEPLAFYLPPHSDVHQQEQSPLYSALPNEIRGLLWEFALADDGMPAPNSGEAHMRIRRDRGDEARVDSACTLLQTCKAVYLETYRLPMLLNGYLSYRTNGPSRPALRQVLPWQYALIQRLDLSFSQAALQRGDFQREISEWNPGLRHAGAYVAPRFYDSGTGYRPEGQIKAHNFAITLPVEKTPLNAIKDGDKVALRRYERVVRKSEDPCSPSPVREWALGKYTTRAMVARPLTHLTLRMSHRQWWTWGVDPTTNDDMQLGLDPACCDFTQLPLATTMIDLAAQRRLGQHPSYKNMWGAAIEDMPDLKIFELILETYPLRKHELDTVAECAKTWKFSLKDTPFELVWDGHVESTQWETRDIEQDTGYGPTEDGSGIGTTDLDEQRVAPDSCEAADSNVQHDSLGSRPRVISPQEAKYTSQGSITNSQNEQESISGESSAAVDGPMPPQSALTSLDDLPPRTPSPPAGSPVPPGYSPMRLTSMHSPSYVGDCYSPLSPSYPESWSPLSPTSPQYSPTSPRWSPRSPSLSDFPRSPFRNEPWLRDATHFEVRIVRFRRRRVE